MKPTITEEIEVPSGVTATQTGKILKIKGAYEVTREFGESAVVITLSENKIILVAKKATKRERSKIYTTVAHIKNMVAGAQKQFVYQLKICAGHFPMNVSISGQQFIIKNFLGEKFPRILELPKGVTVKIEGTAVNIESPSIELAGMTATKIEQLSKIRGRDLRTFQDGIYITHKCGEKV